MNGAVSRVALEQLERSVTQVVSTRLAEFVGAELNRIVSEVVLFNASINPSI